MKDVIKLNIVTIILVISSNIAKVYSNYFAPTKHYVTISTIMFAIYVISNPFLICSNNDRIETTVCYFYNEHSSVSYVEQI